MQVGINTKCPHRSPGITKNPPCGHLVFILFSHFLKKASAQPPTKRANRSSHCQFACSMVRPFHSFHSLRYFAALCSFVCACRSRASHRYTRLALRAMLASLTLIHSLIHFALPFIHACLSLTRQSPLHSPDTIVSCSLRLHSCTSSLNSFASLLRSLTHSTHFTFVPFHMLSAYAKVLCWLPPRLE